MFAEAQKVVVVQGQETPGINFDLAPTRVATITGVATDSQGKPLINGIVMMTSPLLQAGLPTVSPAMTRPDGSFTISNVTPGEYRLETIAMTDAQQLASSMGQGGGLREVAALVLTVQGEDISGVTLTAQPTSAVTGKLVFEGEPDPKVSPGAVMLMAAPAVFTGILPGGIAKVREDWTFEARGLMDTRIFRLNTPAGWFLKKVTLNGTDVTDTGVEFKPGEDVAGVEVVLTRQAGQLAGRATIDGKPTNDYVVVAFASDRARWGAMSRFVRTSKPDQTGKFEIKGLPGEEYLVAALEYMETGEEADPEFLEKLRTQATRVSLADGEAKTVTVKVR